MSISCLRPAGTLDGEKGYALLNEIRTKLELSYQSQCSLIGRNQFYIDFSEVDFVDEEGLSYLLQMLEAVSKVQGQLMLLSVNQVVRYWFASKGLNCVFELFPQRC
jgi:anti-anti-sigma factor